MSILPVARVASELEQISHMTLDQAMKLRQIMIEGAYTNILELGFFHGKSSALIAAILEEMGRGHLTTIDIPYAMKVSPRIEEVLASVGLSEKVTIYYEHSDCAWRLMRFLESEPQPRFDLAYIDDGHTWAATGFQFFLVDKLLAPGGCIVFDDLDWTFQEWLDNDSTGSIPDNLRKHLIKTMSEEERRTPQIRKTWDLLVNAHPGYEKFRTDGTWGIAYKRKS